jgi:hypothetical protein
VALRVGLEDDEIAVVLGAHVDPGAVAPEEAPIVADPDSDRWIVARRGDRHGRLTREKQGKEQSEGHGASRNYCCSC